MHPCRMCFQPPKLKVDGQLSHCTCYHVHAVHMRRHGHMFKKVWQGSVQLLRLVGDGSPLGGQVLPSLDLQAMLRFGLPFPAHVLWDIAAAVAAEEHKGSQLHVLEVRLHTSAISSSHPFHDICLSCNYVCKTLVRCIMLSLFCIIARLRRSAVPASASCTLVFIESKGDPCLWQQAKLQGLERAVADKRKTANACGAAGTAEHALPLCNALRRQLLKRLPGADLEVKLQVGPCLSGTIPVCPLVASHCDGRQEGLWLVPYQIA